MFWVSSLLITCFCRKSSNKTNLWWRFWLLNLRVCHCFSTLLNGGKDPKNRVQQNEKATE